MSYRVAVSQKKVSIKNSTLILIAFATAFFPRLFSYFGAPAIINFVHFLVVPIVTGIVLLTTGVRDRKQIKIAWELIVAMGILLTCTIASALLNKAGIINAFLQFMLLAEPFMMLIAVMAIPLVGESLNKFKHWILGLALFNLLLAIAQSILMPIGIYPRRGGTIQDNIAGVFASGGGSAGNYVSCTISIYFALYFLLVFKTVPLWIRITGLLAALYQTQVSDSKQIFLTFIVAWVLLAITKSKQLLKLILYFITIVLIITLFIWAIQNLDLEFLSPYRNWINRSHIYGPDGVATQTKLAAFRIVPSYYETFLNWLFGLGPGHTVTRLGGWMLAKYASLLIPLGATIHPASADVFQVITDGWIAQESTIFFPLFTWAGIWGDLGFVGLAAYLYLGSVVWRKICVNDFCKFVILTNVVLGFILTQMEEPGQMITVACLLGLCWQQEQEKKLWRFTCLRQSLEENENSL
jgi:hypothetical protein